MFNRKDVILAIKLSRGEVHPANAGQIQLMLSLKVYQRRGEWNGSVESAIKCLRMACYTIDDKKESA